MIDPMRMMRPSRLPPGLRGFEYVRELVRRNSAIVLDETKDYLIEARLQPIANSNGMASIDELIVALRRENPGKLHGKVVEALTTNETHFYRDIQPFRLFQNQVLPALYERNRETRKLRVWSAACSTGQEAYSLAMCIADSRLAFDSWDVQVLGSDINEEVVQKARAGVYRQLDVNRGLPAPQLVKYFDRDGASFRIKPSIARMCHFRQLNLVHPWPVLGTFDVVFLRNVLIYFDLESRKTVLQRMSRVIEPGGHLYLGAAETTTNLSDQFIRALDGPGGSYQRIKEA